VALDECAEDKVALAEENARLKAEVQRDTEIHRRNTAMWKDDCEYHHAENARLKAEVVRSTAQYNGIIDTQLKAIDELKAEVERLRKAGDAMADIDSCFDGNTPITQGVGSVFKIVKRWKDANKI
jgi:hypothetical protein